MARLAKRFEVRAQIADNFWANSSACGNLNLPDPYFRLFQFVPLIVWPASDTGPVWKLLPQQYR